MTVRDIGIMFGYELDKASEAKVEGSVNSLKSMAAKALGAIGLTLSIAGIGKAITECVSLASEVEEMENKFDVVFGNIRDDVDAWAQDYADAIGRNKNDIKSYLADQQNLLVGFGMTREAGAELSKQITTLALDLASFGNIDETVAVNAMTKAVMGESEAAKTLGAVLNDTTRQQAMYDLGLTGTYESLDQLTKMQVNYQAILSQSPDAIGDCERSLASYQSTLRRFQSKLKEVKTLIGQFFMPAFQKSINFGAKGLTVLRNVIQKLNDFANSVGGADKILGVLGASIAATFAVANAGKIIAMVETVAKLARAFVLAHIKTLLLFSAILMLVLLIQDFIAFMRGDQSLFGTMLEKAGVDVEKFRANVISVWQNIKTALTSIWQGIKNVAIPIFKGIGEFIKAAFEDIGNIIAKIAPKFAEFISQLASGEVNADQWVAFGEGIAKVAAAVIGAIAVIKTIGPVVSAITAVVRVATTVVSVASAVIGFLCSPIGLVIMAIAALIAIIVLCVTHWDQIKAKALEVWNTIVSTFSALAGWFNANVVQPVVQAFTSLWTSAVAIFNNLLASITSTVSSIRSAIVNGFNSAVAYIKGLAGQAFSWGADIVNGIANGIRSAIGSVISAASSIASSIKSFLHFSKPDTGPLSDFDTYMPDMMDLMSRGISAGRRKVTDALNAVTGDMSVIAKANVVSEATARGVGGGSTSNSKTINQQVQINNQFNGDRAGQRKSHEAMQKASNDATAQMARALAFAR